MIGMPASEYPTESYQETGNLHTTMTNINNTPSHLEALFVGDLSYFCTDDDLAKLFAPFGPVHKAVVRKSKTNEPLHYGFAEIPLENAEKAIQSLNGLSFLGRKLRYVALSAYRSK